MYAIDLAKASRAFVRCQSMFCARPGYASLPARSLGKRSIARNLSPPKWRRWLPWSGSYKFVFRRDCALEAARNQCHLIFKIQTPVVVKTHLPFGQPFGGENYLAGVVAVMLDDVEDRVEDRHFVSLRPTYLL